MLDLATVTRFLGWCAVINIAVLICATFIVMVFNAQIKVIHSRLMATHTSGLNMLYFNFLANYTVLILMFNLVPYFALRILS
ncbi:MAG: hypothetical protein GXX06_09490 [Gammaproteobacteria bacterium]|nr:hypothetical protein [Gammaproteobacteria bacterium]